MTESPISHKPNCINGLRLLNDVPGEIRTPDPQLRRLLLYPAELLGHDE